MKPNIDWRGLLAVLPLPMLALAASYGVYSYSLLFVPAWVAITQAAAFELTYVGLAVLTGLDAAQRRRAGAISIGAVFVSILYNSLAGLFHRRPELLTDLPWWGDAIMAALHGLPLALVAYFVADLLLHRQPATVVSMSQAAHVDTASEHIADVRETTPGEPARDRTCKHCGMPGLTMAEVMEHGRRHARERQRQAVAAD
jgi:hypothetical protein